MTMVSRDNEAVHAISRDFFDGNAGGHSSMVESQSSKLKMRGSIPPVRSTVCRTHRDARGRRKPVEPQRQVGGKVLG